MVTGELLFGFRFNRVFNVTLKLAMHNLIERSIISILTRYVGNISLKSKIPHLVTIKVF